MQKWEQATVHLSDNKAFAHAMAVLLQHRKDTWTSFFLTDQG